MAAARSPPFLESVTMLKDLDSIVSGVVVIRRY
jgi:hypothetical protein